MCAWLGQALHVCGHPYLQENSLTRVEGDTMQADPDVPPFHYGTHYSAAGVVLYYLIRLEPFTGLSRTLQVQCNTPRAAP